MALLPKGSKAFSATAALVAVLSCSGWMGCGAEEAAFARTCHEVHLQFESIEADGAAEGGWWVAPPLLIGMGADEMLGCLEMLEIPSGREIVVLSDRPGFLSEGRHPSSWESAALAGSAGRYRGFEGGMLVEDQPYLHSYGESEDAPTQRFIYYKRINARGEDAFHAEEAVLRGRGVTRALDEENLGASDADYAADGSGSGGNSSTDGDVALLGSQSLDDAPATASMDSNTTTASNNSTSGDGGGADSGDGDSADGDLLGNASNGTESSGNGDGGDGDLLGSSSNDTQALGNGDSGDGDLLGNSSNGTEALGGEEPSEPSPVSDNSTDVASIASSGNATAAPTTSAVEAEEGEGEEEEEEEGGGLVTLAPTSSNSTSADDGDVDMGASSGGLENDPATAAASSNSSSVVDGGGDGDGNGDGGGYDNDEVVYGQTDTDDHHVVYTSAESDGASDDSGHDASPAPGEGQGLSSAGGGASSKADSGDGIGDDVSGDDDGGGDDDDYGYDDDGDDEEEYREFEQYEDGIAAEQGGGGSGSGAYETTEEYEEEVEEYYEEEEEYYEEEEEYYEEAEKEYEEYEDAQGQGQGEREDGLYDDDDGEQMGFSEDPSVDDNAFVVKVAAGMFAVVGVIALGVFMAKRRQRQRLRGEFQSVPHRGLNEMDNL